MVAPTVVTSTIQLMAVLPKNGLILRPEVDLELTLYSIMSTERTEYKEEANEIRLYRLRLCVR